LQALTAEQQNSRIAAAAQMALTPFASQHTAPGCDWRVQALCTDAHYERYFTAFWQSVVGVYFFALLACIPLATSRLAGLQQAAVKHSGWRAKLKCIQTADMLVLQLILSIVVRLLQATLLFLHADAVLHRVFFEVLFEVCIYTSLKFVLAYLAFLGVLLSKMRAGQQVRNKLYGTALCKVLSPLQMQLFDAVLAVLFIGLGIIDGFYAGLRGIGTWWLTAVASSAVLYFYIQYSKGVGQVSYGLHIQNKHLSDKCWHSTAVFFKLHLCCNVH
jgi:hypothetical protein